MANNPTSLTGHTENTGEPERPPDSIMHRAEHAEGRLPAWLRPGNAESRRPMLLALIATIVMQRAIPARLTRSTRLSRTASILVLAAITIDNTASAIVLE